MTHNNLNPKAPIFQPSLSPTDIQPHHLIAPSHEDLYTERDTPKLYTEQETPGLYMAQPPLPHRINHPCPNNLAICHWHFKPTSTPCHIPWLDCSFARKCDSASPFLFLFLPLSPRSLSFLALSLSLSLFPSPLD